jgi:hypothetical protein
MLRRTLCHNVYGALEALPRVWMQFFRRIGFRCHMSEAAGPPPPILYDEHFRAFGGIINAFARHEMLMVGAMSKLLNTDSAELQMITAELPYRGKRDALLAMIKVKQLPPDQIERIAWFLGELHKYNGLRNAIAHSSWTEGARPNSVKPFSLSVRGGEVILRGVNQDERDYTEQELIDIARELFRNQERFRDYLFSVNLLPRRTAQN